MDRFLIWRLGPLERTSLYLRVFELQTLARAKNSLGRATKLLCWVCLSEQRIARATSILSLAERDGSSEDGEGLSKVYSVKGSLERIEDRLSNQYQFQNKLDFFNDDLG